MNVRIAMTTEEVREACYDWLRRNAVLPEEIKEELESFGRFDASHYGAPLEQLPEAEIFAVEFSVTVPK